jgi:hypothetical protein
VEDLEEGIQFLVSGLEAGSRIFSRRSTCGRGGRSTLTRRHVNMENRLVQLILGYFWCRTSQCTEKLSQDRTGSELYISAESYFEKVEKGSENI